MWELKLYRSLARAGSFAGPKFSRWTNIFGNIGPGGPKFSMKILFLGPFLPGPKFRLQVNPTFRVTRSTTIVLGTKRRLVGPKVWKCVAWTETFPKGRTN